MSYGFGGQQVNDGEWLWLVMKGSLIHCLAFVLCGGLLAFSPTNCVSPHNSFAFCANSEFTWRQQR
jgi:hypothetical protein